MDCRWLLAQLRIHDFILALAFPTFQPSVMDGQDAAVSVGPLCTESTVASSSQLLLMGKHIRGVLESSLNVIAGQAWVSIQQFRLFRSPTQLAQDQLYCNSGPLDDRLSQHYRGLDLNTCVCCHDCLALPLFARNASEAAGRGLARSICHMGLALRCRFYLNRKLPPECIRPVPSQA
jgi:hypothetical protein